MVGIIVHMFGMSLYLIYAMLHCHPEVLWRAFVRIGLCFAAMSYLCTRKEFTDQKYKTVKPIPFVLLGLVLVQPMISWSTDDSIGPLSEKAEVVMWCSSSWLLFMLALGLYVSRIPERCFPGDFDLVGNSHNLFHIFVVVGSTLALLAASRVRAYDWCPLGATVR
jgi:adiponectin receptor